MSIIKGIKKLFHLPFGHNEELESTIQNIEASLLQADFSYGTTSELIKSLRKNTSNPEENINTTLSNQVAKILKPCERQEISKPNQTLPHIMMFVGINGSGKTTTIGKVAHMLSQKHKVLIASCDTFRAAATEQLEIWSNRANCDIEKPTKETENPGSVAYRAIERAIQNNYDYLIIDTSGRLQTNKSLMDQLQKIHKITQKFPEKTTSETFMIIDATIGQNSLSQVKVFNEYVPIENIIISKIDGTSKGGVLTSIATEFQIKIPFISTGETIEDIHRFNAQDFSNSIFGLHT